ncbi:MAG: glycoside hydrolase family 3 C-terminal domain-containing protein [Lachnospiraceae bacterium]|jgi:beta-glucosidase|nr:glycoside hydrolase family 3 C-terminal domain-containing protein [Lachnospiraceae bacterium]
MKEVDRIQDEILSQIPDVNECEIQELLAQMTLDEKIAMIHGAGFFRTGAVERLGIPSLMTSDGPMGVRNEFPDDKWIPVGNTDDYVTYLPSNSALAATWNTDRAYECGQVLGEEARGRGKDVILAPGINIKRDPLCGRNFEYMSEDPHLIEELVAPLIHGIQENDVAACVKHYAVNNQETDRLAIDTIVDERTLWEIYLPGFHSAVKLGKTYSLMNAYNKLHGTFCSENDELLQNILRKEWGYDGTVISDWGSVHSTVAAAKSGLDVEMSVTTAFDQYFFANPLKEAIANQEVEESHIDEKVRNILRMMVRLKMIGKDASLRKAGTYNTFDHQEKAQIAANESVILLKNDANVLPIDDKIPCPTVQSAEEKPTLRSIKKKKIAVIGQNANHLQAAGGGSAEIKALCEISPLMALKMRLGGMVDITYVPGYYIPKKGETGEENWQALSLERSLMEGKEGENEEADKKRAEVTKKRVAYKEEALRLAQNADEVIFVGGLNHDYDTEGRDRTHMKLPYAQDELIEALLQLNPRTIVVLIGGSPVEMPWRDAAHTIVWSYYAGMMTGTAIADVLLGKNNPSGKLPETFPAWYTDTPTAKNKQFGNTGRVEYEEGIFVGYRYYDKENIEPAFAFGHGLSYTIFELTDLSVDMLPTDEDPIKTSNDANCVPTDSVMDPNQTMEDPVAQATLTVTNTGEMAGYCVVQCYVSDKDSSVEMPQKEHKGFTKVFLQPKESNKVSITLRRRAFAFYSTQEHKFICEPGEYVILAGCASNDIRLEATLEL